MFEDRIDHGSPPNNYLTVWIPTTAVVVAYSDGHLNMWYSTTGSNPMFL